MDKKVNSDDLIYRCKSRAADAKFDKFDNAFDTVDKIKNGEISLTDVKNNQDKFKSNLGEIKSGKNKKYQKSKKAHCTILKCVTMQETRLKFFDDCSSMMSEAKAKTKATKGTGLKILTPKQIFQRLPIALAQVKTGNNSESLLNEIKQIVYFLY